MANSAFAVEACMAEQVAAALNVTDKQVFLGAWSAIGPFDESELQGVLLALNEHGL